MRHKLFSPFYFISPICNTTSFGLDMSMSMCNICSAVFALMWPSVVPYSTVMM